MIKQILTITGALATGALVTYFANLGQIEEAESRGYLKGTHQGRTESQVISADFETNVNHDVKLVLNKRDKGKTILVRNPSPAEYGTIGEVSRGIEGMFIPIEQARGIESLALKEKFDRLVNQTIEEKAAQLQALKAARINEQVRLGERYARLYEGEATKW